MMAARHGMLAVLMTFAVWGQISEKVFYFAQTDIQPAMQEIMNAVRAVGDIRDVSVDVAKRTLTVRGTADQIATAGWLTAELDKPSNPLGQRDLPFGDLTASLVQITYLRYVDNPRDLQEIVNAVRSLTDIQRCFPVNLQKAIVMRGQPEQVKAADWVLGILDHPAAVPSGGPAPATYRLPPAEWNVRRDLVLQVAAVTHLDTPLAIQEITNATRSIADMQRVFPVVSRRVLVMRANDDQMALANWLLKELDKAAGQGADEYPLGAPRNQVAQVVFVNARTPENLQRIVSKVREETKMPRVFGFNPQGSLVMLGTAAQIAQARQVIRSAQGQ